MGGEEYILRGIINTIKAVVYTRGVNLPDHPANGNESSFLFI